MFCSAEGRNPQFLVPILKDIIDKRREQDAIVVEAHLCKTDIGSGLQWPASVLNVQVIVTKVQI